MHNSWGKKANFSHTICSDFVLWNVGPWRLVMVAHTYNPSTWEDEAGGHGVWGQSEQNSKFKANLGYEVRTCIKTFKAILEIL